MHKHGKFLSSKHAKSLRAESLCTLKETTSYLSRLRTFSTENRFREIFVHGLCHVGDTSVAHHVSGHGGTVQQRRQILYEGSRTQAGFSLRQGKNNCWSILCW